MVGQTHVVQGVENVSCMARSCTKCSFAHALQQVSVALPIQMTTALPSKPASHVKGIKRFSLRWLGVPKASLPVWTYVKACKQHFVHMQSSSLPTLKPCAFMHVHACVLYVPLNACACVLARTRVNMRMYTCVYIYVREHQRACARECVAYARARSFVG